MALELMASESDPAPTATPFACQAPAEAPIAVAFPDCARAVAPTAVALSPRLSARLPNALELAPRAAACAPNAVAAVLPAIAELPQATESEPEDDASPPSPAPPYWEQMNCACAAAGQIQLVTSKAKAVRVLEDDRQGPSVGLGKVTTADVSAGWAVGDGNGALVRWRSAPATLQGERKTQLHSRR